MKFLIIDNGTRHLVRLRGLVKGNELKVVKPSQVSSCLTQDYDLIILSGSSQFQLYGNAFFYQPVIDLVKRSQIPILGICLGFELIAHAFGASLKRISQKVKGIFDLKITKQDKIFENLSCHRVYKAHRWAVEKLPLEFAVLARSKTGIEIMKHKERQLFGFQFHPELFPERTCGQKLFRNLLQVVEKN